MVDNFVQIKGLLKWSSPDDFYFVQILQRNKEHPDLGNNNRRIREYYIHTPEQLDENYREITSLCHHFNARAYIHVNRRNRRAIALEMLALLAHNIKSHQYEGVSRIYESVCGKHHSESKTLWVVDIDTFDAATIHRVVGLVAKLRDVTVDIFEDEFGDMYMIPTKNGWHLLTHGFNSAVFQYELKDLTTKQSPHHGAIVEIHKNNPTVLYVP